MLDDTIEQLRGMVSFVSASKDTDYPVNERHGFLTFAIMHACQAAIYSDADMRRYGLTVHDYKHVLIKAADKVMNGTPLDVVMAEVPEYKPLFPIDWNYISKQED